jgi:RNA-binding protein
MITSKQRSILRGIANTTEVSLSIGKEGLSDNLYKLAENILESREILKATVLETCDFTAKEIINDFAAKLKAEPVQAIGNKFVIYRRSSRENARHIEI